MYCQIRDLTENLEVFQTEIPRQCSKQELLQTRIWFRSGQSKYVARIGAPGLQRIRLRVWPSQKLLVLGDSSSVWWNPQQEQKASYFSENRSSNWKNRRCDPLCSSAVLHSRCQISRHLAHLPNGLRGLHPHLRRTQPSPFAGDANSRRPGRAFTSS